VSVTPAPSHALAPHAPTPFRPAWWLRGGHRQTLWAALARRTFPLDLRRQRLDLPDGDFIDLDWHEPDNTPHRTPIVVILHGLEGSSASPHIRGMIRALARHGLRSVVAHFRGCSGEPNRLPRGYHSGDTQHLQLTLDALRRDDPATPDSPAAPLLALGYSLGGNVLLKFLGERGDDHPLRAAVAVSVPFDLAACASHMQRGLSRIYLRHLTRRMQRSLLAKMRRTPLNLPLAEADVPKLDSFWKFDDAVTAPAHGFASAAEYYRQSSCRQYLRRITTPTLILHARDDPFMPPCVIPSHADLSDTVTLAVSDRGGHVGFIEGPTPLAPRYWLESHVPAMLARHVCLPQTDPRPSPMNIQRTHASK